MNYTPSEKKIVCEKFDSYAKRCSKNELRNMHKAEKLIQSRELFVECFDSFEYGVVASNIKISDFIIQGNDVFIENISLLAALHRIDAHERELILLKYFMGYTDQEISEELNIRRRTVCDRRNNVVNKLKKYMEES
jgi:RNA polymerase sigma factor (sigma-70 family)